MKNFLKEVLKTTLSTYFVSVVTGVGGVSSLIALFHDVSGYYVIYLCALLLFLSWYCFYLSKQNKANTKREYLRTFIPLQPRIFAMIESCK